MRGVVYTTLLSVLQSCFLASCLVTEINSFIFTLPTLEKTNAKNELLPQDGEEWEQEGNNSEFGRRTYCYSAENNSLLECDTTARGTHWLCLHAAILSQGTRKLMLMEVRGTVRIGALGPVWSLPWWWRHKLDYTMLHNRRKSLPWAPQILNCFICYFADMEPWNHSLRNIIEITTN